MIAGIVLAAGSSSRMRATKQLLRYRGRPLVEHAALTASRAGLDDVVVVLGHEADEIEKAIALPPGGRIVRNPDHAGGQSTSLRAGLQAMDDACRAAVVLLGDQPGVTVHAVRTVVSRYEATGKPIVQATYGGTPGHPVLFDRRVWGRLKQITGDKGARDLLRTDDDLVEQVDLGPQPPPDVDTRDDFERLVAEDRE